MKKTIEERRREGELRMKQWIVEVSRSKEGFAFLEPDLGDVWQSMYDALGVEFRNPKRMRERDEQIARCYNDEIRPPGDDGENWKEKLEEEIEMKICEEIIDLTING
jgi:hypothetical protein